jgi:hypothetical protein
MGQPASMRMWVMMFHVHINRQNRFWLRSNVSRRSVNKFPLQRLDFAGLSKQ